MTKYDDKYYRTHKQQKDKRNLEWYYKHQKQQSDTLKLKSKLYKFTVLLVYSKLGSTVPTCRNPFGEHKTPYTNIKSLVIDHVDGGGNQHRKQINGGGFSLYRWIVNNNFPKGFQTLCMNCNVIKQ